MFEKCPYKVCTGWFKFDKKLMQNINLFYKFVIQVQAALNISSFAIGGFDYLRTKKQWKTISNEGKTVFDILKSFNKNNLLQCLRHKGSFLLLKSAWLLKATT